MEAMPVLYPHLSAHMVRAADRFVCWGMDRYEATRILDSITSNEEYAQPWIDAGRRWEAKADSAADGGHVVTARLQYRQAFYFYRQADYAMWSSRSTAGGTEAYDAAMRAFGKWADVATVPPEKVTVSFDGVDAPGYFLAPEGAENNPVPGVVCYYGADGLKEDHYWATLMPLVERGIAVLVADGPGQGELLRYKDVPSRPDVEAYASRAAEVLAARPEVDANNIAIYGSSFGGYTGLRSFAMEPRFRACLLNTVIWDVKEGLWDYYPPVREQLMVNLTEHDEERAAAAHREFTMEGLESHLDRPLFAFHGEKDVMVPASQAELLADKAPDQVDLHIWPDGVHNLFDSMFDGQAAMWDTLADFLLANGRA